MDTLELTTAQREKERKFLFKLVLLSLLGSAMLHAIAMAVPTSNGWRQAAAEDNEMEIVIENAEEPPKVEEPQEVVQEPEPEIAPEPQEVAFTSNVAPPPLAPDTQAPLAPGEDAPSDQPPSPNSDPTAPLTSTTGDTAVEKGGGGPITNPDGEGAGFGNAKMPAGFNPAGKPDGDVKGVPGGTPGGNPGGTTSGTPGGKGTQVTSTRPTPPPIAPVGKPKLTCLECPKPKYKGAEGDPKVTYDIAPDGRVINLRLRKSSGNADTDRETLETMGKWRFDPNTVPEGGRSNVRVRVTFEEEGSSFQRQNEQRRRESDRQRVAEEDRQRREAERKAPAPAAAIDPPAKSAPVSAPALAPIASPPEPAYVPPAEPVYEAPPEPAYVPPPEPVYEAPPEPIEATPSVAP